MKVATRLRGAFLIYIALLAAVVVYHVRMIQRTVESGRVLTDISTRLRLSSEASGRIAQMNSDVEKFFVTKDTGYLGKILDSAKSYNAELAQFDSLGPSRSERRTLTRLQSRWRAVSAQFPLLASAPRAPDRAAQDTLDQMQAGLESVRATTDSLGTAAQLALTGELAESETAADSAVRVSALAAIGALVLSIILSALLNRSIVGPLERLAEGTREVSEGRFTHRLDVRGNDELAQVGRDFNSMTERLDELDRMKRDFVSKVSHDLKTPLSSMQETISVLLDEVAGPVSPKQRHLLELNLESGKRLAAMLTKLLDLSRLEGGLEPDMEMLDLIALVRRSVDRADAARSQRGFRLSFIEPEHRVLVRGDANGLAQVVDNLLENAIKFSPPDGAVVVRLTDQPSTEDPIPEPQAGKIQRRGLGGSLVGITVSDEGPGIPADEKERIFDRFYQTESGRAVQARGVGLGLTICREIVTAHGGVIWASDNAPRGTTFHVVLPGAVRAPVSRLPGSSVVAGAAMLVMLLTNACTRPAQFDTYMSQGQWADAARLFNSDSSLMNNEHALFQIGELYSSPGRGTYDLARSRVLLKRLLAQFPETRYRVDAADRLALIDTILKAHEANVAQQAELQAQIAKLTADATRLRAALDSVMVRSDSLQKNATKMESDLHDRDEQLRALRTELDRLKAIDLKPRPARPPR